MKARLVLSACALAAVGAALAAAVLPQQNGVVDLLTQANVRIDGAAPRDFAADAIAAAGDVNGDGIGDVILGAPDARNNARDYSGSAYVVFGQAAPVNVDLVNLGAAGFRIDGAEGFDNAGSSVAGAGDLNGDGRADVIVGAPNASPAGRNAAGSVYVIYGSSTPAKVDLSILGASGFRIDGDEPGANLGSAVSAGDVNGDGRPDIIMGAPGRDPAAVVGASNRGAAYVVYGQGSNVSIDLANPLGGAGFVVLGGANNDRAGSAVGHAGDTNGDGRGDVLVGVPNDDNNARLDSGSAYVIYGQAAPADVDLALPLGAQGYQVDGPTVNDAAGTSVADAGDVNRDGRGDIIVGAPFAPNGGAAYVLFGQPAPTNVDLAAIGGNGFTIQAGVPNDQVGGAVDGVGDVNADGVPDVIVGASQSDPNVRNLAGSAHVVFGKATATTVNLGALASGGFRMDGAATEDQTGSAVSAAGDVNGDGRPDVLVAASRANANDRFDSGSAYVQFGFGPPQVSYAPIAGTAEVPLVPVGPTIARTGPASFTITPPLRKGLTLDPATGTIAGSSAVAGQSGHTVTMTDLAGSASTVVIVRLNRCDVVRRGNSRANTIRGTSASEQIIGLGGADRLFGNGGQDCLLGGPGNDTLVGGPGNDTLTGGRGNDTLTPGAGADAVNGGDGNDTVFARDRVRETIRCGGGVDSVTIDRTDVAIGCEVVVRR